MSIDIKDITPLPWKANDCEIRSSEDDRDGDPYIVGLCGKASPFTGDHTTSVKRVIRKDARYIVTACNAYPDLTKYLELALAVIDKAGIVWMAEDAALAALAKAKGEQS